MSDTKSSSSRSASPTRSNRWAGNSSKYFSYIEPERGLAISLDEIRNQDLSIHLYNAHALKRRARQFWSRKRRGEIFDEEGEGMGWVPPKWWTAWPLKPEDVPREGERVGGNDGDDFGAQKEEGLAIDLEESLVAVAVKEARARFEVREEESEEDREDRTMANTEEEENGLMIKQSSEVPELKTWLKPVVSADDGRSADLLRPSIRHTLAKLDELLMGLHYARETCHRVASRSAVNSDDETLQDEESPTRPKRGPGRPRKFADLTLLQKIGEARTPDDTELFRAKKTHMGRPQKVYPRIEGESQRDYLIRIARLQKKPLPSFAIPRSDPSPRSLSAASSRSMRSPIRPATPEELKDRRHMKLALRDWSEVLGTASLVGFSPDVVARAAQRCAILFGESMTMMTMIETPSSERKANDFRTYQPDIIPDLDNQDYQSENSIDDSDNEAYSLGKRRAKTEFEVDSWYCPKDSCRKFKRSGFEFIGELRRHMMKAHNLNPQEIDELLDEEIMDGAVHNDGFLEPIRRRRGLRGAGRSREKASNSTETNDQTLERSQREDSSSSSTSSSTSEQDEDEGNKKIEEQHEADSDSS